MTFSFPARRFLAGAACAFLLLCQTAMAAQACGLEPAIAGESVPIEHCHHADGQAREAPNHAFHLTCPSDHASLSFAKLDAPQAVDLPALMVPSRPLHATARNILLVAAVPARAEPPPIAILRCCLRN